MRLNQKRALFSAIAPIAVFIVLMLWYAALSSFIPKVFFPTSLYSGQLAPYQPWLDGVAVVAGGVGSFSIPLGVIAAAVFWWLDRQEAKS